jgi:hypothetical protein
MKVNPKYLVPLTILVSALGYFVDIYDILLFSIVRQASLTSLGVAPEQSLDVGLSILNWQVGGLILGGILWGAIGDQLHAALVGAGYNLRLILNYLRIFLAQILVAIVGEAS